MGSGAANSSVGCSLHPAALASRQSRTQRKRQNNLPEKSAPEGPGEKLSSFQRLASCLRPATSLGTAQTSQAAFLTWLTGTVLEGVSTPAG